MRSNGTRERSWRGVTITIKLGMERMGGGEEGEDSRSFGERGWKRTGRGARIFCLRRTNISTGIPSRNPEKSPLISRRSFDSTRPRASCSFARVNLRPLLPFKQSSELDQILATRFPPIVRSTGHWIYVWPAVVAIDRISPPGDIKRKVAKNRTKLELDQAKLGVDSVCLDATKTRSPRQRHFST